RLVGSEMCIRDRWWWLGERKFDFNTIGIAQMSVADMGLIRAYGTFSHPNSLAGFLLVNLGWWVKNKKTGISWWLVFWMGLIGIFLSGSRTIWLLTLGFLVFWGCNTKVALKEKIKGLMVGLLLIILLLGMINYNYPLANFFGGWDENGIMKRGQLNLAALGMIKESPWFGVGLGNFLVNLPEFQKNNQIFWFQPVHNILLLIISEIGLLGSGVLVWLVGRKMDWKKWDKWSWLILAIIFVSGMVDHYWFTLPQNMWLLVLVLGVI
ncbi:MAG: O-antigen ligase family protein, partial [Candidatus Shapirobacteria bacterium]|nr:O-antigen ligase family protein [Candidatus Shapirobacteria bacterium]